MSQSYSYVNDDTISINSSSLDSDNKNKTIPTDLEKMRVIN
ncbi:MAG: hypothetical protein ACM31J_00340 [Nitrososphaerales archaeon]